MEQTIQQLQQMQKAAINLETAKISWLELQRFFAAGKVIYVDRQLDLIETGYVLSNDAAEQVQQWLQLQLIAPVTDKQAQQWFSEKQLLWSVVIRPWILVQLPG